MTLKKTISLENELKTVLFDQGAEVVYFIDISQLSEEQNKRYANAVLLGIPLSPRYIQKVTNMPEYVEKMIEDNQIDTDEFHRKEYFTDAMADNIADYINKKGYSAYSQSEKNIHLTGFFDDESKSTPLPHKTIAGLAGLGWIGKHNLLVTYEFGSAISMCTVLTDAPLQTVLYTPLKSQCGDCNICKKICSVDAIKGNNWCISTTRDNLIDVNKCNTCLKCLVFCPWTQKYMKEKLKIKKYMTRE